MDKWVFVNNITSLDKLYILTKKVNDDVINIANQKEALMNTLNENGANRNEANTHPINYILFYNMVKYNEENYTLTKYGKELLEKYNKIETLDKIRAKFFFKVMCSIKYPNDGVNVSKNYDVYPFRIIFKALFDQRTEKYLTYEELQFYLSMVKKDGDYETFIQTIRSKREGENVAHYGEIVQIGTVLSGWCNQFKIFKKDGDRIMISDNIDYKLPILNEGTLITRLPFNKEFITFVIKEYLFNGKSMQEIEKSFYKLEDKRGFLAKDVLDFYQINDKDNNKGIYAEEDMEGVSNFLKLQQDVRYQKIGQILSEGFDIEKEFIEENESEYLKLFREYFNKNISNLELQEKQIEQIRKRQEFVEEYPMETIKELQLEDYVLGNNRKDTFSYKLEYGKYEHTGARIGGQGAAKFGIYKKENGEFFGIDGKLENPNEFWDKLKTNIYDFLENIKMNHSIEASRNYSNLKGMSMVLTKLSFLYYPELFVNICSRKNLTLLMNSFGFSYNKDSQTEELSYKLKSLLKEKIPEITNHDPQFLGSILWDFIKDCILNEEMEESVEEKDYHKYTKEDFLKEVYITEEEYEDLKALLEYRKNIILEGSPGVGKTFMAKRLAYSIMTEENTDNILMIQFHQSYSYEDFIEGIRPDKNGMFIPVDGVFKSFCKKAMQPFNKDKKFYCIIDEINRGNVSKIFGELLMLGEKGKRKEESVILPYSHEEFRVPDNVYVIATMNTADRSLALIDYALRRRFGFYPVHPAFENDKFKEYVKTLNSHKINNVLGITKELNKEIQRDESLGESFTIGHSYFCNFSKDKENFERELKQVIKYDIIPAIKEYWFEDKEKSLEWENKLNDQFND